jgi:hypothetical protein
VYRRAGREEPFIWYTDTDVLVLVHAHFTRRVVDSAKPHETIFHNINYRTAACPPETDDI